MGLIKSSIIIKLGSSQEQYKSMLPKKIEVGFAAIVKEHHYILSQKKCFWTDMGLFCFRKNVLLL